MKNIVVGLAAVTLLATPIYAFAQTEGATGETTQQGTGQAGANQDGTGQQGTQGGAGEGGTGQQTTGQDGGAQAAGQESSGQDAAGQTGAAPAGSADANADADRQARDQAQRNAEAAGLRDVMLLDRVFVLQGTTPSGETVFMIVNPPGALIGVGAPTGAAAGTGAGTQSGASATIDPGDPFGDIDTSTVVGVEPADIANFVSTIGEENAAEMKERCDVISGDPSTFGVEATRLCDAYLKWWGENR